MDLIEQLKRHEGFRSHIYQCTGGCNTIGYGTNLDAGITQDQAEDMLKRAVNDISLKLDPYIRTYPSNVQKCLINMGYNLGVTGVLNFKKMFAALDAGDYARAADEALDSKWATQVPNRAIEITDIIRKGQ